MKIVKMFFFCLIFIPINLFSKNYSNEDSVNIASQLNSIYQANFIVNVILDVDSVSYNYNFSEGRISDPYNTLGNCLVFLASQIISSQNFGNSLMGIYRENQIVWYSNEIVKPSYLSFGQIYGIIDLNDDGMVDILSQWVDERDNYNQKYLWIFSWDGNTAICINEGESYSRISTHGYSDFELVDIEGDGIWEIAGFGVDEEFVFIPEIYKWNGSKYSPSNITINSINYFFPRNNFLANVKCNVTKVNDSTFNYNYIVFNNILSKQSINEFYLEKNSENLINLLEPSGWHHAIYDNLYEWYDTSFYSARGIYITKNVISSGKESNFSYKSVSLPSIQKLYLRGYNFPNLDPANGDSVYNDIFNNSISEVTIGIKDPPYPFITSNFLDTLLNYNQRSLELGWITNQSTANKYNSLFNTAKSQLQQNNNNAARTTLQTVLQQVDIDSTTNPANGTSLTNEAYALLRYNTEYLLESLPEPINTISTYSLFATHSMKLNKYSIIVQSGDIGVNTEGLPPLLESGYELSIGANATTPAGYNVKANRILLNQNSVINGDIYYNELNNSQGVINGTQTTPLELPLFAELPEFKSSTPGTEDITVSNNGTRVLTPGSYGNIFINKGGTLVLSGGTYRFSEFTAGQQSNIQYQSQCEVRIAGRLDIGKQSNVIAADTLTHSAKDIVFYVGGINGTDGTLTATPKAAVVGTDCKIRANIYVPNGTVQIKANSEVEGSIIGKDVDIDKEVKIKLKSAY